MLSKNLYQRKSLQPFFRNLVRPRKSSLVQDNHHLGSALLSSLSQKEREKNPRQESLGIILLWSLPYQKPSQQEQISPRLFTTVGWLKCGKLKSTLRPTPKWRNMCAVQLYESENWSTKCGMWRKRESTRGFGIVFRRAALFLPSWRTLFISRGKCALCA